MNTMFSKYSLLFTRKSLVILYTFGAAFGLVVLLTGALQVIGSYASGEGFDVPAENFYYSELFLFLPFYIVNGYLLRLLVERWRINRRTKKLFYIAEYDAPQGLSPAHIGLLIDNDIRTEEVVATLYDLQRRGVLAVRKTEIALLPTRATVTEPEKQLIDVMFSRGSVFTMDKANAELFLAASNTFRKAMLTEMRQNHLLPMPRLDGGIKRLLFGAVFMAFSYLTSVFAVFLIVDPSVLLAIQYPRYAMEIGQPIVALFMVLLVLAIACSGFITTLFTKNGRATWRLAAGYRLYIETVFRGTFGYGENTHNSKEQQRILPYAIALGIEKKPVQDFVQKLGLA